VRRGLDDPVAENPPLELDRAEAVLLPNPLGPDGLRRRRRPVTGKPTRRVELPELDLEWLPDEGVVRGPSGTRELTPLSRRLLAYLVDNRDRVVPREELVAEVWPDVQVTDAALRQALRVLRREVGPGPAERLVENVRGRGVRLGVRAVERTASRDPMLGRDAELGELLADAERARAGQGRLGLVSGPAGIGKTRLLEELAARLARRGFGTQLVRCAEAAGLPALWPWAQVLRGLLVERRGAPLLDALPSPDALALLLVLDDLQHMDAASLGLLEWIATHMDRVPLLIAASYRDPAPSAHEGFGAALGRLARLPGARELGLRALLREAVLRLARAFLPEADEAHLERIWLRSGGNPFYLRIALEDARRGGRGAEGSPMSEGIREATLQPLEDLSAETRALLSAAAVLGTELQVDRLGGLVGLPRAAVEQAIHEALEAGLLGRSASGRPRFVHALVMEALDASLDAEERARLHAKAVETLSRRRDVAVSEVAEHALAARSVLGDEIAADWCARAAQEAADALAFEQAAFFLQQALGCSAEADPRRRLPLLVELAEVRGRVVGAAGAEADAERAMALARELGDAPALVQTVLALGQARGIVDARPEPRWIAQVEAAVERAPAGTVERARLLSLLADAVWFTPDIERARRMARESVALASEIGDADAVARSSMTAFRVLQTGTARDVETRDDLAARLASALAHVEDRLVLLEGGVMLMWNALVWGDGPGVADQAGRVVQEAEDVGGPHAAWWASVALTTLAYPRGDLAEAEAQAERGLELGRSAGIPATFPNHALQTLSIRRDQGRLAEMEGLLGEGVKRNPQNVPWLIAWRLAQLGAGSPGPARELLRSLGSGGVAELPENVGRVPLLVMLVDLAVALEDVEAADALYGPLRDVPDKHAAVALGFCHWGAVARHLGRVEAVRGDLDAAAAHLEEGLARDRALGAVVSVAHGQIELGTVLARRGGEGDAARGARLREEGAALAADLGLARI